MAPSTGTPGTTLEPARPTTRQATPSSGEEARRRPPGHAFRLWVTVAVLAATLLAGWVLTRPGVEQTAEPSPIVVEPLYTPYELWLLELVRDGHIPKETLDTETFRLKRLANEGKIPRAAAR